MPTIRHARSAAFLCIAILLGAACASAPTGTESTPGGGTPDGGTTGLDGSVENDGSVTNDAGTGPDGSAPSPPNETCPATFSLCEPAAGTTRFVLLRGTVVGAERVSCDGEVLFSTETGKIVCAGDNCKASPDAAGAQVVCANGVIFPGLIDPHQHADYNHMPVFKHERRYDNRNTWRKHEPLYDDFKIPHKPFGSSNQANQVLAQRYAEVRLAMSGATTMSGTAGSLLGNAGISGWIRNIDSFDSASSGLAGGIFGDPDTDSVVVRAADGAIDAAGTQAHLGPIKLRMATPSYRAFLPHIAEGIDANARLEFDEADKNGVITDKTAIIHCVGCSTTQFARMAEVKADLIWSPRSNIDLYGLTANVTTAHKLGVRISLGVDWTPSGSMNPIGELQCAAKLNDTYLNHSFTDAELVAMSTLGGAQALNLDDQLGKIEAGYLADLTVIAGDRTHPFRALIEARAEQVRLVTIGGLALYGDTDAVTGTIASGLTCSPLPESVCGAQKSACTTLGDLATLSASISSALGTAKAADTRCSGTSPAGFCYAYDLFPLFRCGGPELDRCDFGHPETPRRASGGGVIPAVSGTPAPGTDDDGDGFPNESDNCPRIFNPPFDTATAQDDANGNGIGDACDPTPCLRDDGTNACKP
jgi:large repetitive protein